MSKITFKSTLAYIIIATVLFLFFSFKLAQVPNGINLDEASYGHNGVLLAQNLRDQHGRRFPIFILGSDNKTWYAPYMQYLVALMFKLFGPSVFTMRLASVIVTVVSGLLVYYFADLIFTKKKYYPLIALAAFVTIPEVMIETHTPLEHMIVVPFTLVWLIGIFKYKETVKNKFLALSALSLGIGFYSYAGIRPFVAVWAVASVLFILYLNLKSREISLEIIKNKKLLMSLLVFVLTIAPFFAIIPLLEFYYAGAVLNGVKLKIDFLYEFFYYYISSFDFSFLFVKGDKLMIQSTLKYGMFLISSLPLFLMGIYQSFKKKDPYFVFLGITFLLTPLLYGFVKSEYFAHRLLYMVPFYAVFVSLAVTEIIENRQKWVRFAGYALFVLVVLNYVSFWKYYMFTYPKDTANLFHHIEKYEEIYKEFKKVAQEKNLKPYISKRITPYDGTNEHDPELFAQAIYFPQPPTILENEEALPENAILLTEKNDLKEFKKVEVKTNPYFVYTKL